MRIGMLVDVYKPHISGITNYVALNKKFLEKSGEQVYIFTFSDEGYQDDEPNVIRSSGLPLGDTGYYLSWNYSQAARKLLRTMDIVHVHHPFISGNLALRLCHPRGIPILFTNHTRYDLYAQAYIPGVGELVGDAALRAYLPPFCRSCDLVVAPSPGMCQVLKRFGVDAPVEVVPNGVDLEPFRQPLEPLEREAFGFQREDVILLYVGRLGPEKNLPFLLRAVAGAAQAYRNVRLLLVGGGPEVDNLKDRAQHMRIQEHVTFAGPVEYDQVPRYMLMADVFVTASLTEVHPLSVIEAMAAGKPVLGMISPGVGDTVEDWQTGLLSEPDDLAGFTAKLVRLVVNPQERHEMGARARQASEQYAIERTTQMMLERYQRLVEASTGRKNRWRARMLRWWDGFR